MAHTFHNRSQAVFCIFGVSPNFITYVDNHIPLFGCIIFASGFFYKKKKQNKIEIVMKWYTNVSICGVEAIKVL